MYLFKFLFFLAAYFIIAIPVWAGPVLDIVGESALVLDSRNGQVLFEKNAHQKMYPASTTKILTAVIALERGRLDDVVTIPACASGVEGSAIGLQEGERLTLEELLYAMMLNSGNDSALAVACHIGGSVEGFVDLMNQKSRELGAIDSHFANPNGLPDDNHFTSAYDLALISRYAMQNPVFRKIVGTKTRTIHRDIPGAQTYLLNHNKLIWNYDGADGIKTGYTTLAKNCLVASARRPCGDLYQVLPGVRSTAGGDRELIAVVLGSEGGSIWSDTGRLLDYGFDDFVPALLVDTGHFVESLAVRFGKDNALLQTGSSLFYDFSRDDYSIVRQEIVLYKGTKAPVTAGEKLGDLVFFAGDKELGRVDLVAQQAVERKIITRWWLYLALAALFYTFLITRRYKRLRRRLW